MHWGSWMTPFQSIAIDSRTSNTPDLRQSMFVNQVVKDAICDRFRREHNRRPDVERNNPDIPITVDAKLPDDESMTLRQRMHVTRAESCYKCHSKMNPLGLPFELYDHYGRFRFDELKKPVDTTSKIVNTGIPGVDGDIKNPFELIERLANSTHCEQVFVRYVFRFFMGRNETLGDAKTLQEAHKAYSVNGGRMKALVVSLVIFLMFLLRFSQEP